MMMEVALPAYWNWQKHLQKQKKQVKVPAEVFVYDCKRGRKRIVGQLGIMPITLFIHWKKQLLT